MAIHLKKFTTISLYFLKTCESECTSDHKRGQRLFTGSQNFYAYISKAVGSGTASMAMAVPNFGKKVLNLSNGNAQ